MTFVLDLFSSMLVCVAKTYKTIDEQNYKLMHNTRTQEFDVLVGSFSTTYYTSTGSSLRNTTSFLLLGQQLKVDKSLTISFQNNGDDAQKDYKKRALRENKSFEHFKHKNLSLHVLPFHPSLHKLLYIATTFIFKFVYKLTFQLVACGHQLTIHQSFWLSVE